MTGKNFHGPDAREPAHKPNHTFGIPRCTGRNSAFARPNLTTARRTRAAGIVTACMLSAGSLFMTLAYLDGLSSRAAGTTGAEGSSAREAVPDPRDRAGDARAPTAEDTAVFASLFAIAPHYETEGHDVAALTGSSLPAVRVDPFLSGQEDVAVTTPVENAIDLPPGSEITAERDAPIGSIATSRGQYSIHRDARGRVFVERVPIEPSDVVPAHMVREEAVDNE